MKRSEHASTAVSAVVAALTVVASLAATGCQQTEKPTAPSPQAKPIQVTYYYLPG